MSDFVIENGVLTKYTGPGGDVVIPEGTTEIGECVFVQHDVTRVTIPEGVTAIGASAFFWCSSLICVTIPNSVTAIGDGAFRWCGKLTAVTIPDGVTAIGNRMFEECPSLRKVVIPDSVTYISNSAFDPRGNLRIHIRNLSLLPAKVRICAALCYAEDGGEAADPRYESHGKYLKANSGKMVETAMKNHDLLALLCREGWIKAKDIEAYVDAAQKTGDAEKIAVVLDYQNSKLTKKQKENVDKQKEKAENTVFDRAVARMNQVGIVGLNFVVTGAVETFANRNELKAFIESQGGKLQSSMSAKTDYLIMNDASSDTEKKKKAEALGIDVITELQFNDKSGWAFVIKNGVLTKYQGAGGDVVIPDSVTAIGWWVFSGCKRLTSVTIPDSVTSIGWRAFDGCADLSSLTIHGKAGSCAEAYATEYEIPFVAE